MHKNRAMDCFYRADKDRDGKLTKEQLLDAILKSGRWLECGWEVVGRWLEGGWKVVGGWLEVVGGGWRVVGGWSAG